jgi:CDP-diacylglycerol--serine O-phosphatidyltransferase
MFIGKYNKSVIVTYLGVVSTMIGIYFILGYDTPNLTGAIICLMISGICDMFDGKFARMMKKRTDEDMEYGIQIDSLTDMVSFIAFPIVTLYGVSRFFDIALHPLVVIIAVSAFTICGISRLAFFNMTTTKGEPVKYYSGLPVTTTAMIFPAVYLFRYVLSAQVFVGVYLGIFALVAFLFVFNFKIRKPKKNWWYTTCCTLAFIMTIVLIYLRYIK